MRTFLVTLHKVVSDGRGHDQRVLQRRAVVSASYEEAAAEADRQRFYQRDATTPGPPLPPVK